MTKQKQDSLDSTSVSSTDSQSQLIYSRVGYVFCSEENDSFTSLDRKNSNKNIFQMIDELNNETKNKEKTQTKQKKIKKVQIASWTKAQINKLKQLLKVYGTDFQTIAIEMNKTRDQVKRKFKVLQKKSDQVMDCVFDSNKQKSSQSQSKQSIRQQCDLQ